MITVSGAWIRRLAEIVASSSACNRGLARTRSLARHTHKRKLVSIKASSASTTYKKQTRATSKRLLQ